MSSTRRDPRAKGTRKPIPSHLCPSCLTPKREGEAICYHCNFPFQAPIEERKQFLAYRRDLVNQYSSAMTRIRFGTQILYFLGVIGLLQTALIIFMHLNDFFRGFGEIAIGIALFLGVGYLVLGFLSKKYGIVPLGIGAGIYLIETMISISLSFNWFSATKIFLAVCLIIAFVAAISAQQTKVHIERTLGKAYFESLKKFEES